jgi:RecJ-like exonuclease
MFKDKTVEMKITDCIKCKGSGKAKNTLSCSWCEGNGIKKTTICQTKLAKKKLKKELINSIDNATIDIINAKNKYNIGINNINNTKKLKKLKKV